MKKIWMVSFGGLLTNRLLAKLGIYIVLLVGLQSLGLVLYDVFKEGVFKFDAATFSVLLVNVLFLIVFLKILRRWSYYIGWDEHRVAYLLPGNWRRKIIPISEMEEIVIGLTEVHIQSAGGVDTLKLRSFTYLDLKAVKEHFEELKLIVEGINIPD